MATFNIVRTGSLVLGGSSGHAETRFTLEGGTVETHDITGTLDHQWMVDNEYFDVTIGSWLKTIVQAYIGNTVTIIGNQAFGDCHGLTSITIGNGVTSIGDLAFAHCESLTSVTIPASVESIGAAFYDCSGLTTITVLGKTTAAAQTLLANANVPEGCTIVGELG